MPKPTQIPQPTKPVQPAKPTATPPIPKPTAVPQPTATPKPVKVSSITLNQTSLTLTSKGQTASLTATVSPANAANKSLTWSSSDSSVVTVNANGTVTAVANGTADITATAADGSGVSAKCSVTVKVPNNITTISLEGGKSKILSIWNEDYVEDIDVSKVTFEYDNSNCVINVLGYDLTPSSNTKMTIEALRRGSIIIKANYNGRVLKQWNVQVTSDWQEYLGYVSWRHTVESKIWTDEMSLKDKMDAAKDYIKTEFSYKLGYCQAVLIYSDKACDCIGSSDLMGGFAKDAGAQVKYGSTRTGKYYDYLIDATTDGGHTFNSILINGKWEIYDAQP
ncbi:hypothetical protein G5B28_20685 [Blautia faecis]|nr:hypothetical protein [Blautia faecis]